MKPSRTLGEKSCLLKNQIEQWKQVIGPRHALSCNEKSAVLQIPYCGGGGNRGKRGVRRATMTGKGLTSLRKRAEQGIIRTDNALKFRDPRVRNTRQNKTAGYLKISLKQKRNEGVG